MQCTMTNTRVGYQVLSKQCIKKKSTMLPPTKYCNHLLPSCILSYRLEITGKETAEECCYSYATLSIDCHFRNAYRKVKELGMSPPIQQHQRLTSLGMAPLPYNCIPACILRLSRSMKKNILLGIDKTFVGQMPSYAAYLTWYDLYLSTIQK